MLLACPHRPLLRSDVRRPLLIGSLLFVSSGLCTVAVADTQPHPGMMRYPDVGATHIVFSYANDLWLAPREGGVAASLASPPGLEAFPRFSPDGKSIAFVGNYDGNEDIYTIPVAGGAATRVTFHPGVELLCDWTPDGKSLIYFGNGLADMPRQSILMTVPAAGGLPEKLPVPYGANGAISSDGWLAYTPHTIDNRTWKRYRGGMQTDIWLYRLKDNVSKRITDWEGTDSQPMWHGQTVYYMSDAGPEHRMNIWAYDVPDGPRRQVTNFQEFDIKWPAIGPGANGEGEIILQNGAGLFRIDLKTGAPTPVAITIPGDRPLIRPQRIDASRNIEGFDLSATGKRAVMAARGDVWSLPAKNGSPRNLTSTAGVNERDPAWSPDGKTVAYFSDGSGEYELYTRPADGGGEPKQLTRDSKTFYYMRSWSPDSKRIAFGDKAGNLMICTVENGAMTKVDTDPAAGRPAVTWSSDSRWVVYTKEMPSQNNALWLYDAQKDEKHELTSGMFNDDSPQFDRTGDFLYFISARKWSDPQYEDLGTTFAYHDCAVLLAVPLRKDVKLPWGPKSDEEGQDDDAAKGKDKHKDKDKDQGKGKDKEKDSDESDAKSDVKAADDKGDAQGAKDAEKKEEPAKPVLIDIEGFEARAVPVPVKPGPIAGVGVTDDNDLLLFRREDRRGGDDDDDEGRGGNLVIKLFDPKSDKREEKNIISGISGSTQSADGKKLLVRKGRKYGVIDAKPEQKMEDTLPTDDMKVVIDPRAEWAEILREAWRLQRDFFYEPTMHHVPWEQVYAQYSALLPDCYSREDVTFLVQEMISELNVGHAYYRVPPSQSGPSVSVGLLGCDFAFENGAYRIKKLYRGADWDTDARNPLLATGVNAKEGEYLLAINGVPLDAARSPYAAAAGLADKVVTLTLSEQPGKDPKARDVVVKMLGSEVNLRFRGWIESKRAYVASKTNGQVGYIYVPNTGVDGQNELFRQFYQQRTKAALIIDERWNGGGQIPTRFIELLNRPLTNYWARRDGRDWVWPPDSHQGPQCMLINGLAGSGGDMFPWLFRYNKLGKLIGTRTWGGLVGISGNPSLVDGSNMTVPTFGFYEKDGTWGVEGHGVDPDIEVIDDPALMRDDGDPQLDVAIELMLSEIKQNGYHPPKRPQSPDRKGMGIPEADH